MFRGFFEVFFDVGSINSFCVLFWFGVDFFMVLFFSRWFLIFFRVWIREVR